LQGIPIVEVPAQGATSEYFAVLLSGDGGWAGIDKAIAAQLAARGIPVVGWDSLRYFWSEHGPETLSHDLDRVLRHYAERWKKTHAIVIGYSQGADVLSFGLNRLPPDSRSMVADAVMIAPGRSATFAFHFSHWLGGSAVGTAIQPEVERLDAAHTLCIYGEKETDSLCPLVAGTHARSVPLPGSHHFDGNYAGVAQQILEHIGAATR
jgi:type IV secretory pathway VirJ component